MRGFGLSSIKSSPTPACFLPLAGWLKDNTPYDPQASAERLKARRRHEAKAWANNLMLIALQALLQLPSALSLM